MTREQSGGKKNGLGSWWSLTQPCKAKRFPTLPSHPDADGLDHSCLNIIGKSPPTASSAQVRCRRLRLTLQDQELSGCSSQRDSNQVYLKAHPEEAQSVKMMADEVTQIHEVRYCLKTLREQMASRQNTKNNKHPANGFRVNLSSSQPAVTNGNTVLRESDAQDEDNPGDSVKLREATKRFYTQLKDMETRHEEERERLQAESRQFGVRLARQTEQLQAAEKLSEERGQQVEELQRLLGSMAIESRKLKDKMAAGEQELLQLKADNEEGEEDERRCKELNKEVAVLKEKIHHLDDMLKSQQRKVRHMIEQLQNSRTVIQERDRSIRDLEERVVFLEAENREMHDHLEYFLASQEPPKPESTEKKPEVVYSKTLTPTTQTNKALPFIKIIEIKS
ncbi:tuftelin 1b [Pungitius pungitius]|uniref:tuftelin 1b n=1 Tax=Pungitius pungitius TaxID=134920 RepID=UPI002E0FB636